MKIIFERIWRKNFKRESAQKFKWQKNIRRISFVDSPMKCKTKQTTKIAHLMSLNQALLFVAHWKWQNNPKHWHLYRFIDVFCTLDWHETCNKKDNKEGQTVWSNNYKQTKKVRFFLSLSLCRYLCHCRIAGVLSISESLTVRN